VPTEPGVYLYREHSAAPVEPIHVYVCEVGGWPRYGWQPAGPSHDPLLLAKRAHDPEAVEAQAMRGLYLCRPNSGPEPLEEVPFLTPQQRLKAQKAARPAQEPAPARRKKKVRRKASGAAAPSEALPEALPEAAPEPREEMR